MQKGFQSSIFVISFLLALISCNSEIKVDLVDGAKETFKEEKLALQIAPPATTVNLQENLETIVTLNYIHAQEKEATSCSLVNLVNISITTPCTCVAGVCTVGLTGLTDYSGDASFGYSITVVDEVSDVVEVRIAVKALITGNQTLIITNNLDDVENVDTSGYYHLPDGEGGELLWCGYWYSSQNDPTFCSFRFQLVNELPEGVVITNVQLSVRGKGNLNWDSSSDHFNLSATYAKSSPQITGFDDVIGKANGYIETSNKVRWPATGGLSWVDGQMTSPDISPVIQELVDNFNGLNVGDSVTIWLHAPPTSGNSEVQLADLGHAEHSTSLVISYEYYEQ